MTNDMPYPAQALIYRASNRLFSLVIPRKRPCYFAAERLDRLERPSTIVLCLQAPRGAGVNDPGNLKMSPKEKTGLGLGLRLRRVGLSLTLNRNPTLEVMRENPLSRPFTFVPFPPGPVPVFTEGCGFLPPERMIGTCEKIGVFNGLSTRPSLCYYCCVIKRG